MTKTNLVSEFELGGRLKEIIKAKRATEPTLTREEIRRLKSTNLEE